VVPVSLSPRFQRTSQAILDAAAHVLAGESEASLDDVAQAADVGRATLFRHFPSREALLAALHEEAIEEIGRRFVDAGLDGVAPEQALERIVRAVLVVGDRYSVLMLKPRGSQHPRVEEVVRGPIREVLRHGSAEGTLRADVSPDALLVLLGGALQAGIRLRSEGLASLEDAVALITSFALRGMRAG
jgi:TetR/AcrR family transcriptional regulator, mexCD-oprJ operon repressor